VNTKTQAKIYAYYSNETGYADAAQALLEASDIADYIDAAMSVAIKPNLVNSKPASYGSTTHPEVVEGIIRFLLGRGIKNLSIIEGSWVGESTKTAFRNCGYEDLSKKYKVPLFDLKGDATVIKSYNGQKFSVCAKALETDFLINVPVLKAHCQTKMTCCLKNLKGVIPDGEKRRYHTAGIHKPVAVLNAIVMTGYCVVDSICGDLTFEEGGNPVPNGTLIAGRDPLAIDSYCAKLIGFEPDEIDYIRYAKKIFSSDGAYRLTALNKSAAGNGKPAAKTSGACARLSGCIEDSQACSACYASLIRALWQTDKKTLDKIGKIKIGQGYRGQNRRGNGTETGLGVGDCCKGFETCVPGCPPDALQIRKVLYNYYKR